MASALADGHKYKVIGYMGDVQDVSRSFIYAGLYEQLYNRSRYYAAIAIVILNAILTIIYSLRQIHVSH